MNEKPICSCHLELPYPEAVPCCPCKRYARLLSRDFAGTASEMTAVNQYLYQSLVTAQCNPELSAALSCIANVEMHHFHILGELIVGLGGDPVIGAHGSGGFSYWSGRYPLYTGCISKMLKENIRAEQEAIRTYSMRICQIGDDCVQRILERIILDERLHIRIFEHFICG